MSSFVMYKWCLQMKRNLFLSQVESTAEGEAQRYFDHALTLKNTILFLRYNKELTQDQGPDIPNIGNYICTFWVAAFKKQTPESCSYMLFISTSVCLCLVKFIIHAELSCVSPWTCCYSGYMHLYCIMLNGNVKRYSSRLFSDSDCMRLVAA